MTFPNYCSTCGNKVKSNSNFCSGCGNNIKKHSKAKPIVTKDSPDKEIPLIRLLLTALAFISVYYFYVTAEDYWSEGRGGRYSGLMRLIYRETSVEFVSLLVAASASLFVWFSVEKPLAWIKEKVLDKVN